MVWQAGDPSVNFETPLGVVQTSDDWEEWLKWDPAADVTSSENAFSHSGSSKNDSPIHDFVLPAMETGRDKLIENDLLAPPLVVGEDDFDLGAGSTLGGEVFAFSGLNGPTATFDFDPSSQALQGIPPNVSSVDADAALWLVNSNTVPSGSNSLPSLKTDVQNFFSSSGPPTASTPSFHESPDSSTGKRTSLSSHSSPDPSKRKGGRKRKVEIDQEQVNEDGSPNGDEPPVKKTSHNVIEKRYRNNLNDKIVELRNSVPSLRAMSRTNKDQNNEDLEGLTPAHKHNKATIMAKATEYIRHLEKRNQTMSDEMLALKARLTSVETAFNKSRSRQGSIVNSPPNGTGRSRESSSATHNPIQSYLNMPQAQSPFTQQQYMQQQPPPTYNRPPHPPAEAQNQPQHLNARGGLINKIMVGGMAGLMVMEGISENQSGNDSSTRGLGTIPGMHLIQRRGLDSAFSSPLLPILKVGLVVCAIAYLVLPFLHYKTPRKQTVRPTMRLPRAPSLASPVEVRRNAWLTAIQSVWVPKHFLLEVVAVSTKMIKLSVRRIIGAEVFTSLTGASKEEEAARVKAWDIAIDAQLAGGDAEVSYHHLLLTLMASGTLPDSPVRLMQKAVHFRVFFWEVANAGYGNLIMFKKFTEKVGNFYWESARKMQKELVTLKKHNISTGHDHVDALPNHLAALLDLDCDEVLSDEMIQRAWNLAWNKPSANGTTINAARDSVVMDHAIRSPLDAIAAWYSNILVDETIAETLASTASKIDMEYHLALAVSVAPPASATHSRTLAAKAVLSRTNRISNITATLDTLPVVSPNSPSVNLVNHGPVSPEVRTALTMAKLMSLSSPTTATPAARLNVSEILSHLNIPPQSFTLLTAVAAYQMLQTLSSSRTLPLPAAQGLEDLACSLRIWVGTSAGRQAGLDVEERAEIIQRCLHVAKRFGGWDERDSGYGSVLPSKEASPIREVADFESPFGH